MKGASQRKKGAGKGGPKKQKSSERGRMEWRTGKEHNSGAISIEMIMNSMRMSFLYSLG